MSEAATGDPKMAPPEVKSPETTKADETREIKTYEDAVTFISAALQNGGDASVLQPLLTFFKTRIERAPKPPVEPDEEAIKKAQLSRRTWKPYSVPAREQTPAP
jgi:hypothetical protein